MIRDLTLPGLFRRMDWVMTIAIGLLCLIGILFVYSSCFVEDDQPVRALYKKQTVWCGIGFVAYLAFSFMDYRRLRKIAWSSYWVALLFLVLVLIVGVEEYGATRRLQLPGFSFQPSELAKIAIVLVLSRKLSLPGVNLGTFGLLAEVLLMLALPFLLILKEPDLGTALVLIPTAGILMFVAGMRMKTLGIMAGSAILAGFLLIGAAVLPKAMGAGDATQKQVWSMTSLNDYHRDRILVFLGVDKDPLGAGWTKRQSQIAVGSGGLLGKGFTHGRQNVLGFLPRSVAPTDFIYSVIAEETGFLGSVVVLFLFGVVLSRAYSAALQSADKYGRLLCVGVACVLFFHVFVNIGMTVGMTPITGIPLPLLSYGGSFMVVTMSMLGIVQSVWIRSRRVQVLTEQRSLW